MGRNGRIAGLSRGRGWVATQPGQRPDQSVSWSAQRLRWPVNGLEVKRGAKAFIQLHRKTISPGLLWPSRLSSPEPILGLKETTLPAARGEGVKYK